jgi:hypothetical protein
VDCDAAGDTTKATITYSFVAINEIGIKLNEEALEEMYVKNLEDWQMLINHYLATGKMYEGK